MNNSFLFQLQNIVALVTGGVSGIGAGVVKTLHQLGSKVCILDINATRGTELEKELGAENVIFIKTDVSRYCYRTNKEQYFNYVVYLTRV